VSEQGNVEARLESMERRLVEIQHELASDLPRRPEPERPVELDVSAGPFTSTDAVREFERELARLPGVRDVMVRGYEPGNRAIIEVQLDAETS
jgi:hypothetical protein